MCSTLSSLLFLFGFGLDSEPDEDLDRDLLEDLDRDLDLDRVLDRLLADLERCLLYSSGLLGRRSPRSPPPPLKSLPHPTWLPLLPKPPPRWWWPYLESGRVIIFGDSSNGSPFSKFR